MGKKKKSKKKASKVVQFSGRSAPDFTSIVLRNFEDFKEQAHQFASFADFTNVEDLKTYFETMQKDLIGEIVKELKGGGPNAVKKAMEKAGPILDFFIFLFTNVNEMASEYNSRNALKMLTAMNELEFLYTMQEMSRDVGKIPLSLERMPLAVDEEMAAIYRYLMDNEVEEWDSFEDLSSWVEYDLVLKGYTVIPMELFHDFVETDLLGQLTKKDEKKGKKLRKLFRNDRDFKLFENKEDFSYGFSDINDEEYIAFCDSVLNAIEDLVEKNKVEAGKVMLIEEPPSTFLESVPLINGAWVHSGIVELLEFYGSLEDKGYDLDDPDPHPLALKVGIENFEEGWGRLMPDEGEEIKKEVRDNMKKFSGRKEQIDGIEHLHIDDYLTWEGRFWKEEPEILDGVVISSWDKWVEEEQKHGEARVEGVAVSKLVRWLTADEMAETDKKAAEKIQEERNTMMLRASTWTSGFFSSEKDEEMGIRDGFFAAPYPLSEAPARFRIASIYFVLLNVFKETMALNAVIENLQNDYFNGKSLLFDVESEILDTTLQSVMGLIFRYNEGIGKEIAELDRLSLIDFSDTDGEYSWGAIFSEGYYFDLEELSGRVEAEVQSIMESLKSEAREEVGLFLDPIFEKEEEDDDDEQIPF